MGFRQVIIVRKDLNMSAGKFAAQACHASMAFLTAGIRSVAKPMGTSKSGEYWTRCEKEDAEIYLGAIYIEKELFEDWFEGPFTKTICEAKNKNKLMKAVEIAEELGLKEGEDYFLIRDNCLTELEPEDEDGRTLTAIGFAPLEDEVAHKISKKFQLFKGEVVKPKKGRWISHTYEEDEVKTAMWAYEECSVCHKGVIEPTHYCPNCGAEMINYESK